MTALTDCKTTGTKVRLTTLLIHGYSERSTDDHSVYGRFALRLRLGATGPWLGFFLAAEQCR